MTKRTNQDRLLAALQKRMRVTRKTAIENGWCENLTATVSDLRKKGYNIEARTNRTEDGKSYTRYSLIKDTDDLSPASYLDINQVA